MPAQVYTFKITYEDCNNKIWRIAAVSSNYTLAQLGYMVLATFDTMAYHLFEMKYDNTILFLSEKDFEDLPYSEDEFYDLMCLYKIGSHRLNLEIGDTIEMTYDMGCCQAFNIELVEIGEMPKGHGRAYPKILDGEGRGIVDDMPANELLEVIRIIDSGDHSGIYYSNDGYETNIEWDYRKYDLDYDNALLKGRIELICDNYEYLEE